MATIKYIFYFCGVKSFGRYEAAAKKQRFLYPSIVVINITAKECGRSNPHKVSARVNLTAPSAVSFMSN
jgi:hypothetical protein